MTAQPVAAVFLWRLDEDTPFKAVYGRVSGSTTYTKDYLQLRRAECAVLLDRVMGRQEGTTLPVTYEWPGGSTTGELRAATDHDPATSNYRLQLAWPTDNAPIPWQLGDPTTDQVVTVPGTPGPHGAKVQAEGDTELAALKASNVKPWIVAVKLQGPDAVLHLRAYLEAPPPGLERLSSEQLPEVVRTYMASMPSGCGAVEGAIVRAPKLHRAISDALTRSPNVLLVGPPGTGKTVALEDSDTYSSREVPRCSSTRRNGTTPSPVAERARKPKPGLSSSIPATRMRSSCSACIRSRRAEEEASTSSRGRVPCFLLPTGPVTQDALRC